MQQPTVCLHFAWRTTSHRVGGRAARRSCLPGLRRGGCGGRQAGATVLSCLAWRCELALSLPGHCQPRGIEKISACAYTVAVRELAGDDQVNHVLCTSTVVDARCAKQQHLLLHTCTALTGIGLPTGTVMFRKLTAFFPLLAYPLCPKRRRGGLMFCCCFIFNYILVISFIPIISTCT